MIEKTRETYLIDIKIKYPYQKNKNNIFLKYFKHIKN